MTTHVYANVASDDHTAHNYANAASDDRTCACELLLRMTAYAQTAASDDRSNISFLINSNRTVHRAAHMCCEFTHKLKCFIPISPNACATAGCHMHQL